MKVKKPLTKENFWDDLYKEFPVQTQVFCDWIDEYKKAVDWNRLFNEFSWVEPEAESETNPDRKAPKFHDLPHAMQMGICIEFITQHDGTALDIENLLSYGLDVAMRDFIGGKI